MNPFSVFFVALLQSSMSKYHLYDKGQVSHMPEFDMILYDVTPTISWIYDIFFGKKFIHFFLHFST